MSRDETRDAIRSCPICGRGEVQRFRPFCSSRCADVDLGRWLTNSYAIPVEEGEPDEPETPSPPSRWTGPDGLL